MPSNEVVTKEIAGHTYELTLFGTRVGQRVFLRLVRALGPAFAAIVERGKDGKGEALSEALGAFKDEDQDYLIEQFAAHCKIVIATHGKTDASVRLDMAKEYDNHFKTRYAAAYMWLGWCIVANFASFLGGMENIEKYLSILRAKVEATVAASSPPPGSIGSSSGSQQTSGSPPAE